MKIINIGILAHVDAGKTTLTESLLYTSGAILELGSVDKGTTRTDTMFLERQRGITIQAAVTSFNWNDYKINIVDTPGHTDFITEVYRSLSVLDGAILVISAKDGVQAQTRILFHALQKMNIPTIIFILRTRIEPIKIEEREKLLDALTEIADTDPLLRYCVDTITHEIVISFLGTVQLEVICSLLIEKYHINIRIEDPTVIYLEKPLQKADYTIHIEVPPNPFWASIGLSITPLPIGSGIQYESKVSLGYLNQSFQNAVREGINYGLEQGLYGWEVTDCKICFEYGVYYSPVSTPSDFRFLAPIVLEQTLKKAGTQLLEPYLSFILFTPQGYLSRAYNDAQKHCAIIETSQSKNDEIIFTGHIPVRCINEYRNTLTLYTNGQAVFLTELKDYQIATCEPVIQSRRPNNRIDKVRHMFNKKEN